MNHGSDHKGVWSNKYTSDPMLLLFISIYEQSCEEQ